MRPISANRPSSERTRSLTFRDGIHTTQRLERKLGVISFDLLNKVKVALRFALDL